MSVFGLIVTGFAASQPRAMAVDCTSCVQALPSTSTFRRFPLRIVTEKAFDDESSPLSLATDFLAQLDGVQLSTSDITPINVDVITNTLTLHVCDKSASDVLRSMSKARVMLSVGGAIVTGVTAASPAVRRSVTCRTDDHGQLLPYQPTSVDAATVLDASPLLIWTAQRSGSPPIQGVVPRNGTCAELLDVVKHHWKDVSLAQCRILLDGDPLPVTSASAIHNLVGSGGVCRDVIHLDILVEQTGGGDHLQQRKARAHGQSRKAGKFGRRAGKDGSGKKRSAWKRATAAFISDMHAYRNANAGSDRMSDTDFFRRWRQDHEEHAAVISVSQLRSLWCRRRDDVRCQARETPPASEGSETPSETPPTVLKRRMPQDRDQRKRAWDEVGLGQPMNTRTSISPTDGEGIMEEGVTVSADTRAYLKKVLENYKRNLVDSGAGRGMMRDSDSSLWVLPQHPVLVPWGNPAGAARPRVFLACYDQWRLPGQLKKPGIVCDSCCQSDEVTCHGYRYIRIEDVAGEYFALVHYALCKRPSCCGSLNGDKRQRASHGFMAVSPASVRHSSPVVETALPFVYRPGGHSISKDLAALGVATLGGGATTGQQLLASVREVWAESRLRNELMYYQQATRSQQLAGQEPGSIKLPPWTGRSGRVSSGLLRHVHQQLRVRQQASDDLMASVTLGACQTLAVDATYKVAKIVRSSGSADDTPAFGNLYTLFSGDGLVLGQWFCQTESFAELRPALLDVARRLQAANQCVLQLHTDRCCAETNLWTEIFGPGRVRMGLSAQAAPLLPTITLQDLGVAAENVHRVTTRDHSRMAVAEILQQPSSVIGLDLEWEPAFLQQSKAESPTSTVQLALFVDDVLHVFVFWLAAIEKDGGDRLPRELAALLEEHTGTFVGRNIATDCAKLARDFNLDINSLKSKSVDVAHEAYDAQMVASRCVSLSEICQRVCGKRIDKSGRLQHWESELDESYAAIDAAAHLVILQKIRSYGVPTAGDIDPGSKCLLMSSDGARRLAVVTVNAVAKEHATFTIDSVLQEKHFVAEGDDLAGRRITLRDAKKKDPGSTFAIRRQQLVRASESFLADVCRPVPGLQADEEDQVFVSLDATQPETETGDSLLESESDTSTLSSTSTLTWIKLDVFHGECP